MNKSSIVTKSFNEAIEEGFNNYLEKHATFDNYEVKIDEEQLMKELEEKWLNEAIAEIDNITPKEYINSLASLQDLMDFFAELASASDVGIPDILIDRFKEHGLEAADMLFEFAKNNIELKTESNRLAFIHAVYVIGLFKYNEYKEKLIGLLMEYSNEEMISEAVRIAISEYGDEILQDLIKAFNEAEHESAKEHLLICIAEISKDHPSDEVYYLLKSAFRVLNNIKVAAEVLGDYGDGRAIPMLRGYVIKNNNKIDKDTFNLIRAVIKKLGGEIDDLVYGN
ncbi:hypothetical protein EHE19_003155 [Ruminiclostridium herbifermentans]|uniref:HEAT repeat domain-containing protein n=1 Tax=Ruminiclostridium herbifermentans TaxID=2488810 RepID=A0A4U7JJR3_9FIRM|nr:hypothetical protein [Ruminiclostridium herbifermentans]QNU68726.1 hypothetical protein EHE19_003155 [Ruminiclostridium herbifermentans]